MKLPKLAIENHQFTIVVIILLAIAGMFSFYTMPKSEDPQITQAGANIFAIYPGANPKDIEELVMNPIEEVLNELEDIKKMNAHAEDGLMVIHIEFQSGSDPDDKYSDVVQRIGTIRHKLPVELLDLEIDRWEISRVNILQIALLSDSASYRTLEKNAELLENVLERIHGVKRVKTWAFPEQEIRVSVDLPQIAKMHIPLQQVINAIQSAGANIPGGNIDIGNRRFTIQTSGSFQSITDIKNTVIHSADGKVVSLSDIAKVERSYEDLNYYARFNQKRAVFVTVSQKVGSNIYQVMENLKAGVNDFLPGLPESIQLKYVFDQSVSVSRRINGFFGSLMQGVILVGLIVFMAMSIRASLIVMLVIPTSILIAVGFVDLSGFGMEQMSIAGLVIALGLLVDNAIVVTENVSRFLKKGYSRKDAAVKGTGQIAWAVVSSTATTVLSFLPIVMMRNVTGDFIRSMPVTVIYALTASLVISLTLTPFLASRFLKGNSSARPGAGVRFLNLLIERNYRSGLAKALGNPKAVLAVAVGIFLGSLALFPIVGVSFFPKADKPEFLIDIDTPKGTSLAKTNAITQQLESVLSSYDEVKHFAANIGRSNPFIYYNILPKRRQSTHAQIFVELREAASLPHMVSELRQEFAKVPGAHINVKEFEQGPPVEAPIAIKVLGEDLNILKKISHDVEKMIASSQGTINIQNPLSTGKTDLHININRPKAAMMGVPLIDIDRTVRASIAGLPVSTFRDKNGKDYDIVVRLPISPDGAGVGKSTVSDFNNIYLASYSGAQIPLKQIADIQFKSGPMTISHYNMERSVTVTADVLGSYSVDRVTNNIISQLEAYDWPVGYRFYVAGELENREESFGGLAQAVAIALIAIFGALVLQFRSFKQPLIVFTAIPLAMVGSILALLITGYSFSFTAFVGLTSLVGIVVNNSIILVDYTNQLRREGKELIAALREAAETRFTPIVLTTATTVGGLLPLTIGGGSMWAPMGWAIIGGLIVSTFLTLFVVPVLYKLYST